MSRPLLFYAQWPFGYFNPEADRKAVALADAGYDVTYVAGIGTKNPRLATLGKAADRIARKLLPRRATEQVPLRTAGLLIVPPRQVRGIRHFNERWVQRQLRRIIPNLEDAVVWLRWPTQELVEALARDRPAALIYERVDAYESLPGLSSAWAARVRQAEDRLLEFVDAVVVPGEVLGEDVRPRTQAPISVIPHGVDLGLFRWPPPEVSGPPIIGFVGTLDWRIEVPTIRCMATRHPEWTLRLVGEIQPGFDPASFADLPNVEIVPPIPHSQVGEEVAAWTAGMMPYRWTESYRRGVPIKNLELMAAGKPGVARPNRALDPYDDLVYLATTPEEFCAQMERAIAEDSPELRAQRRARAEAETWERRLDEIVAVATRLAAPR